MFDEYRKKLEDIGANSDKVFKRVAKQGAKFFQKEAVRLTDQEKLVDTGTYKRNWEAVAFELDGDYGIVGYNGIEYASFLEDGYDVKKHFVPFPDNPKAKNKKPKHTKLQTEGKIISKAKADTIENSGGGIQKFMREFRNKYPNAKGFMAKARRFRGRKIGRRAMDELRYYCIKRLDDLFDKLFTKHHQSFTQSD